MTTSPTGDDAVRNDHSAHRYELMEDGEVAGFVTYEPDRDRRVITLVHTEIDDRFEGKGYGGRLARAALDEVKANGWQVVPRCPFIAGWIERHPDYADLVVRG
jgi:uncharacterized protein